jgi:plasmid stability protein
MAARVKKRVGTSTDRESDKIIVRLPEGMRHALAELAARNGRSMTAEVVTALAMYFEKEDAAKKDQLLGVETAIRELAANQQQTLELVKKIIQSPAVSRSADDMVDMVDRLDRILAIAPKK